ncbi:MAG: A/G-specific adenine glycosylase [Caulobacterales bacterium]
MGPKSRKRADPYRVWLSEIMLQQTTVAAVGPYFAKFLSLFPDVKALASAPREQVLAAWAGLGYYSRARNLHAAALILAEEGFPQTEAGWRALPGVGPYTAAAISAIALGLPTNVVDGNVERVISRLRRVEVPLPAAKPELVALAGDLIAPDRPGDYAQALMDLGATICTPAAPKCLLCPWSEACAGNASGAPETYPRRLPKNARPERRGAVFILERDGAVLVVRREDKGLLGGMSGLPTTEWRSAPLSSDEAVAHAPAKGKWKAIGAVRHVFTHFGLTLDVYALITKSKSNATGEWIARDALDRAGLPRVFGKAIELYKKWERA